MDWNSKIKGTSKVTQSFIDISKAIINNVHMYQSHKFLTITLKTHNRYLKIWMKQDIPFSDISISNLFIVVKKAQQACHK